ncbi:MAG: carboxypeptidase-like regulatory domain-containing protein [Alistipes finegoldii]
MKNRFADTGKSYAGYFLRFVFCLVLTASALSSQAQSRNQVSGKVTDTAGEPLIGATVVVVGTTTGTTTGIDGSYTINAAADSQLKFSFIGYAEQTVNVGARSVIDIVMEDDSQVLKDVVVIGYGTMEKKSVTSSITSIKGDDLGRHGRLDHRHGASGQDSRPDHFGQRQPQQQQRLPAARRGFGQRQQGPLVIIDGIPGGDMRALNQEDIESVDVLKDASAGAIYGTRRRRCDLVTTKQARQGRVTARYTGEFSVEAIRKTPTCSHQASTSSTDSARTTVTTPTGTRSLPTSFRFRSAIR